MSLIALASKNLLRNRFRTILTALGAATGVVAFVAVQTVLSAWYVVADSANSDRLATRHKMSFVMPMPRRHAEVVRQTPGVAAATWLSWFGGKNPKEPDHFFYSIAVDTRTFLDVIDEVSLSPVEREAWLADKRGAIVGDVLARRLGVSVGDQVTLRGTLYPGDWPFVISGIYTPTRRSVDRSQFIFHWDYLNERVTGPRRDTIGVILARITDPARSAEVSRAIDGAFAAQDVPTKTVSERVMSLSFVATLSAVLTALDVVSIVILFIMMLIMGNTIAMSVRERVPEHGVLRAIGFSPRRIGALVVGESLVLGVLSGLGGVALAYPVVELGLGHWLEENAGAMFPYVHISLQTLLVALAFSILTALVAGAIPAARAARLGVAEALRRVA
jgi:putative ABC transport system permease protein